MINSKLLKNSARIGSLLSEQKSASLDPNYNRVQGPTVKRSEAEYSTGIDEKEQKILLNGDSHVIKTELHPTTGEYIVVIK